MTDDFSTLQWGCWSDWATRDGMDIKGDDETILHLLIQKMYYRADDLYNNLYDVTTPETKEVLIDIVRTCLILAQHISEIEDKPFNLLQHVEDTI